MISLILHLLRLLPFLLGGHRQLALENLALRQQLAVYKRTVTRPPLRGRDRLFWVALASVWAGWKQSLVIVTPDTVLRWQRRRFRAYWTLLSGRPTGGRPPIAPAIRALVRRMAAANPLWGAPRIHAELLKLGITLSERPVCRLCAEAAHTAIPDVANVPRQSCPRSLLLRFLHGSHGRPARPLRSRRARSPSAARRTLQRDRTPHRPMDGPPCAGRRAETRLKSGSSLCNILR